MNPTRVCSLYSGSSGNSFLIASGDDVILIDAGKSAARLCEAIRNAGCDPDAIRAIFVTHEHTDHISALPVFLKKHPVPVHLPLSCSYKLESDPVAGPLLVRHPPLFEETVGSLHIRSFPTPHDSRGSVGYRIETGDGDERFTVGYATDIGFVSDEVREGLIGCDAVILESNHDPEMLETGSYPADLKRRIASRRGHLSNPVCAAFAAELCEQGTKYLMLAHLSRENNTPDTAYEATFASVADDRVKLCVASPDDVTVLI